MVERQDGLSRSESLRPDSDPDRRLRAWFDGEVRRASRDLAEGRPWDDRRATARRTVSPVAVTGIVALLAIALGASFLIAPRLARIGSAPSWTPTSRAMTSAPNPTPGPTYPGGMPMQLDGQPVLVGAAITAHVQGTTHDSPFLIGGITYQQIFDCASPNASPGLPLVGDGCGSGIWLRPSFGTDSLDNDVRLAVATQVWIGTASVLRVHVHDPQAEACPAAWRSTCEAAIVVEAVAWVSPSAPTPAPTYPGGMPTQIDGQPVLVGAAITARVKAASDDSPFLVGGEIAHVAMACVPQAPSPISPLLPGCQFEVLEQVPPDPGMAAPEIIMPPDLPLADGVRVVLRAHVHDQRAADCRAAQRETCLDTLVAETLVWLGPNTADEPQVGGYTSDGLPTSIEGLPVPRISSAVLAQLGERVSSADCCLLAGWAVGLDTEHPGHLQVADAADASRVWSIDLGLGFQADVHGPVVIDLSDVDPLKGVLAWHGGT